MKRLLSDLRITHTQSEFIQLLVSVVSLGLLLRRFLVAKKRVNVYRATGALPPTV